MRLILSDIWVFAGLASKHILSIYLIRVSYTKLNSYFDMNYTLQIYKHFPYYQLQIGNSVLIISMIVQFSGLING